MTLLRRRLSRGPRQLPRAEAQVRLIVNGVEQGSLNLANGDSLLYTHPGLLIDGRVAIAEDKAEALARQLAATRLRVGGLEDSLRLVAHAESLDAAIGIAYRSGAL